jgi:hypothetical protein
MLSSVRKGLDVSVAGKALIAAAAGAGLALAAAGPASAGGNIFLTGHDTDFHFGFSASAHAALVADLAFVRAGSSLPVLVFDTTGGELDSALTSLGIAHTTMLPSVVTDASFNASTFSAIAVASDTSCGGCDLTDAQLAALATHQAAIGAFVTAGGGVLGLSGAGDATAYAYVPTAATNAGGNPPVSPYFETAAGTAAGLLPENGDPTHNFFSTPGTMGLSSAYIVAETLNMDGTPESVFIQNATITCTGASCTVTGGVPEASTWMMMLLGFLGLGVAFRKSRNRRRVSFA